MPLEESPGSYNAILPTLAASHYNYSSLRTFLSLVSSISKVTYVCCFCTFHSKGGLLSGLPACFHFRWQFCLTSLLEDRIFHSPRCFLSSFWQVTTVEQLPSAFAQFHLSSIEVYAFQMKGPTASSTLIVSIKVVGCCCPVDVWLRDIYILVLRASRKLCKERRIKVVRYIRSFLFNNFAWVAQSSLAMK